MQSDKLKSEIASQYDLSKKYLDPIHERFNGMEELYRAYINPANYPHSARVFDSRVFRVVETVTPRLVANEPQGSFYPQEKGDMGVAKVLNALIKYDWSRAEMFRKLVMYVKSMLIFGTAFGRTYWDYREKEKTQMVPKVVGGKSVWTPKNAEKVKVCEYDGPNFEVLNIYDCFPDPNATDMDNMRWFIFRRFKTLEELKAENETRGGEYYQNLDELEAAIKGKGDAKSGDSPSDLNYREHRRVMLSTEEYLGKDESNPDIVILRRFTRDRWVDYCPEHNVIIRDIENPYFHGEIPIIYGVDYPYPGELYGMGEIEPVERIQRAINAVLNQRLDNVQLNLNSMWKVRKGAGVDLHTLVSKPGNVVLTNDMSAVETFQVPDVTSSTFVQTMNYLTSALQNNTGITDYTLGINTGVNTANKTATGTRLIQQEANAQFKLKIQLFNKMVVQTIANQWKDLRLQYTTEPQMIRIMGEDTIKYLRDNTALARTDMYGEEIMPGQLDRQAKLDIVSPDFAFLNLMPEDIQPSIVGNYDFVSTVTSETISDQAILQENFFAALDRITSPPWTQGLQMQGKSLDYNELTKKVFDKLQIGLEGQDLVTDAPNPNMPPQALPGQIGEGDSLLDGQLPPEYQQAINDLASPPLQ